MSGVELIASMCDAGDVVVVESRYTGTGYNQAKAG